MPGGTYRDLSTPTVAVIARRWPLVDAEAVNSAAKSFQLSVQHRPETPKSIRKTMDELVHSAVALRVQLTGLSEEALDHLWDDLAETRQGDLIHALPAMLDRLKVAAMRAHNLEVGNDGRGRTRARHQLVTALAWQLKKVGITVNARPNGDLCQLVRKVLEDLKACPADVPGMVNDALARIGSDCTTPA